MAAPGALLVGRYRLVRQLGAGGMGVVWEAHDDRLDRPVAVKQLRTQPGLTEAETDVIVQRAMREARINARLHHPYAVSVFDVVEHEGKPCIVMELVPSIPLTEAMRELGSLAPTETARVGSQVAAALAAAHALGIVHRDVKPGNVLISDDGTARICDFGISRALGDTTLTMTGMITGTPAYVAPETARGEESTSASDVFSLGATLYAAVEGEPPFGTEGNAIAVLYRVVAGELRPPQQAEALGPLLVAMMSTDPRNRPSMAEAATQLSALADSSGGSPRPVTPEPTLSMTGRETSAAPASAWASTDAPETTERRPALPAAAPPPTAPPPTDAPQPGAAPTTERRRRRGLVAAIVVLIGLAGIAAIVWWAPNLNRPSGSDPGPAVTNSGGTESAPTPPTSNGPASAQPSATGSGEVPTTAELGQAVTDYYALLPDDTDAAWELLTPSYQRQTGNRESYDDFWNDIDTVTVTGVRATAPDQVQATLTYVEKSGNRKSTERRSFRVVRSDGVLKIDQSAVI